MAHRTTLEEERLAKTPKAAKKSAASGLVKAAGPAKASGNEERERIFDAFRRWGYLEATLDPLALFALLKHPALDALTGEPPKQPPPAHSPTIPPHFTH